jgi:hypothetical protein
MIAAEFKLKAAGFSPSSEACPADSIAVKRFAGANVSHRKNLSLFFDGFIDDCGFIMSLYVGSGRSTGSTVYVLDRRFIAVGQTVSFV